MPSEGAGALARHWANYEPGTLDEQRNAAMEATVYEVQTLARALLAAEAENERLREALTEIHEYNCGCSEPGRLSRCVAQPVVVFATLATTADGEAR